MIDIKKLTEKDVGAWAIYSNHPSKRELGRIKSWSQRSIFVVYNCDVNWSKFRDYTGCSTAPEYLEFVK